MFSVRKVKFIDSVKVCNRTLRCILYNDTGSDKRLSCNDVYNLASDFFLSGCSRINCGTDKKKTDERKYQPALHNPGPSGLHLHHIILTFSIRRQKYRYKMKNILTVFYNIVTKDHHYVTTCRENSCIRFQFRPAGLFITRGKVICRGGILPRVS